MKSHNKKSRKVWLVMLFVFLLPILAPTFVQAQRFPGTPVRFQSQQPVIEGACESNDKCPPELKGGGKGIRLQIPIPGVSKTCQTNELVFTGEGKVECIEKDIYYVENFQQYISTFFKWFLGAIALVAVVMIMVGGFIWMLAAGNATRIGEAKATIGGALGGLILTLAAFTLFNTLNPDIVNLTLQDPQPIKPIAQPRQVCETMPVDSIIQILDDRSKEIDRITIPQLPPTNDSNYESRKEELSERFACPNQGELADGSKVSRTFERYQILSTNAQQKKLTTSSELQCLGVYCEFGGVCLDVIGLGQFQDFQCFRGHVVGKIIFDSDAFIDNDLQLRALCNDNTTEKLFEIDLPEPARQRFFSIGDDMNKVLSACTGKSGARGYYLRAEINDPGTIFSLGSGNDDWFPIDRTCRNPLSEFDPDDDDKDFWKNITASQLIKFDELNDIYRCDLNIKRPPFRSR